MIICQCDFQPGNPAGGTETVCFYDSDDVLLGCSYNCQITGQQIKCGYNAASVPYPTYYKVTFSSLICYNASVLPIKLIHFTVKRVRNNNAYEFSWSTQSEKNNAYFEIEKSSDGINYEKIAKIEGAGTSNLINSYKFIDENIYPSTSYYRLKQVDFNNNVEYFKPLSIHFSTNNVVDLKHNPTNYKLITIESKYEIQKIKIISSTGNLISFEKSDKYINLESVEKGLIFFETILSDNRHIFIKYMNL